MIETSLANQIIESLRNGLPPQRGTWHYAVGHENLRQGIRRFHLDGLANKGIIRFVSGSWGAGKTHFFRLLREEAFQAGCLVSTVELSADETPLNKFEKVFFSIVGRIAPPSCFAGGAQTSSAPFGGVLREALTFLSNGKHGQPQEVTYENVSTATEKLMACNAIDIDFRKIIKAYWETFLPDAPDPAILAQKQDEILQWFSGEGMVGQWRRAYGINKLVNKGNAKLMLQSLAAFVRLVGYEGLVILFDEAERSYSSMRKSALRDAHNNLLHLINNVSDLSGLFLLYATTPDFYNDPKHGIVIYGALAGRIGEPNERLPRAVDNVWNLDAIKFSLAQYQEVAAKIRKIYLAAYPASEGSLSDLTTLNDFVTKLDKAHPSLARVRFWRVLTKATVERLDDAMEGVERAPSEVYNDVMDELRES